MMELPSALRDSVRQAQQGGAAVSEEDRETYPQIQQRLWRMEHVLALLAAIVAAIAVYYYTGESEIFLAIGSGAGIGALTYIASWLHLRRTR
jgi:hypothetical protein